MWSVQKNLIALAVVVVFLVLLASGLTGAETIVFSSRVNVALTPEQAWRRLSDLNTAHHYVPGIVSTAITTAESRGVGASRRAYSSDSDFINETVTEWDEGRGFTLRLHGDGGRAPTPFEHANFSYRLVDTADANETTDIMKSPTTVELVLSFEMRGGYLGYWFAREVMAGRLQERTDDIAQRLKAYYESPGLSPVL